ncbi:MAG: class I SAM-dependent methyltransferase [Terriglobia bacterium]
MANKALFDSRNEFKLNLGNIYNKPDPRDYFNGLGPLRYIIPELAKPVFQAVFAALRNSRQLATMTVLDLGCSYGINAALLKYGLCMRDLYHHYGTSEFGLLDRAALLQRDAALLNGRKKKESLRLVGMDAAPRAVSYATDAGLLDAGVTANLETGPAPPAAAAKIASTDIIISTGCVGYVSENTFSHILEAVEGETPPWVASFVLRMFPYDTIEETLAEQGLTTEKLAGRTFMQRCFASEDEQVHVLGQLEEMHINPAGKEAEGQYHAEFFLSRPPEEIAHQPLEAILP